MPANGTYLICLTVATLVFLLFLILVVKLHAFVALLISAMAMGLASGMPPDKVLKSIQTGFGDALGFIVSEDQLQVVLEKMAAGQTLEVDAYDRDGKTKLAQGSLTTLDNQIDPTTGTLKLRATFRNPKGTLFPNQFVNARLLVQEKHGVTLVPTTAVQRNSQATYVYVVKADSSVTVRPIVIGTTEGDDSEVTSGLAPGEVVVMTGVDKLQEGSKVKAQVPSASPPASPAVSPPVNRSAQKGAQIRKAS